jgi:basic membrane protein A
MKKAMVLVCVLAFCMSMLAGCGSSTPAASPSQTAPPTVEGKAACILGVGGLGDQSYNDLVYAGMKQAEEELGVKFDYAEPKQISDFELIMRDMASSGEYGVIVCVGFDQVDPLTKVAPEFPEQKFAIIDGEVAGENIASYTCKEEEGSFLVGVLAGLMKKNAVAYQLADNNQVGFVGALEIPLIVKFNAGFQAGAKYVNPNISVQTDYVSGNNPFSDTTTAKEIALSQNTKGADIIYHAAGGSGLGVFQAAKEKNFFAIGCNSNQNTIDPDHIVASMLKRVDTAAFQIVKSAIVNNSLITGSTTVLGIKDEGVGYTLESSNIKVSPDDLAVVESIREKIASGALTVPENMENIDGFLSANTFEG